MTTSTQTMVREEKFALFEDLLTSAVRARKHPPRALSPGECQSPEGRRCHLCLAEALGYEAELTLKQEAMQKFWDGLRLPVPLQKLIPSPMGRGYRTVSKRRAFSQRGPVQLALIDPGESGKPEPFTVEQCAIEPAAHIEIYKKIQEAINKPYAWALAEQLNYVVIKGNYREFTVILNVREISGKVIKVSNTLSKSLTHFFPSIVGFFLYLDESGGRYYLGVKNPRVRPTAKKLFGKNTVFQKACGKSFLYSPLSFSQVNQSLVDRLIGEVGRMLALGKESRLIDLYCGYGLFALCLGDKAASVVGAEISHDSIESAIENATRQKAGRVRFLQSDITSVTIDTIMKQPRPHDKVILDPPRGGTSEGVIETIAALGPERVVHLFCNIDVMHAEIKRWLASGYEIKEAVPLDMFPGTATVETVVLFGRAGAVNSYE
jgi:tRNA/tmRNA/rRNA uracil-C5-methylase (TrmA/RlmC/RlmD family)